MKLSRLGALGLLGLALACEPAAKPGAATTAQSNTVAVLQDGTVASLDADHNQLVLLGLDGSVRARVDVGQRPIQLTTRGNTVAVSNTGERSVSVVDATRGQVTQTIPVGVEPRGLVFLPDGTLAVALGGERAVAIVDVASGTVQRKLALPQDNPYGLAVTGDKLYVTHLLGDALSSVDLQGGSARAVPVSVDVAGLALNPSLSRSVTVSPDGNEVAMPNVNLNNEGLRPDAQQGGGGYLGTPDQMPAVNPTLTVLDTRQDVMISKATPADVPMGGFEGDCFDCGRPAPTASRSSAAVDPNGPASALLTQTNGTVPFDAQLNDPIQTAYLANGRGLAVLARGSRNVFIWRRDLQGQRRELLQVTPVGHGADGMAVTADGKQLLVHNAFDLTLDVVSLPEFPETQEGSFLGRKLERDPKPTTGEAPVKQADRTITVAEVTLPADVAAGRRLFHDATLPSMTQGPGITCGTCHADGRNDNKTWMFIDGPRNTQSLAAAGEGRIGLATTTAPLHWKGEITTHLDLQRTVTEFMGGSGLNKTQLDQLAAFIDTIPAADNPVRDDESRFAELIRGEELFNDTTVGCASCHSGPHFTDNKTHEVQTDDVDLPIRDGRIPVAGFQTPVLHGVMFTAPYGHDGRYPTLEDLLEDLVRGDKMGKGSHLSDADMRALATYLRSL